MKPANGHQAPTISLEHVNVVRDGVSILQDINVRIESAKLTAIIGPNGAGKTTLLYSILGLIPFQGSIRFQNPEGTEMIPVTSYVPQSLSFDRQSPITVLEFMALDRQNLPIWFGINRQVKDECREALSRLHAEKLCDKPMGKLSGGEMQRVLLAKALQRKPNLLLLDEPVSGVDIVGGHLFCDVLEEIGLEREMTIVMVSHDLSVVSRHAQRVICLNQILSCEGETPKILTPENLQQLYGIHAGLYEHHPRQPEKTCDHHHHHD